MHICAWVRQWEKTNQNISRGVMTCKTSPSSPWHQNSPTAPLQTKADNFSLLLPDTLQKTTTFFHSPSSGEPFNAKNLRINFTWRREVPWGDHCSPWWLRIRALWHWRECYQSQANYCFSSKWRLSEKMSKEYEEFLISCLGFMIWQRSKHFPNTCMLTV